MKTLPYILMMIVITLAEMVVITFLFRFAMASKPLYALFTGLVFVAFVAWFLSSRYLERMKVKPAKEVLGAAGRFWGTLGLVLVGLVVAGILGRAASYLIIY